MTSECVKLHLAGNTILKELFPDNLVFFVIRLDVIDLWSQNTKGSIQNNKDGLFNDISFRDFLNDDSGIVKLLRSTGKHQACQK